MKVPRAMLIELLSASQGDEYRYPLDGGGMTCYNMESLIIMGNVFGDCNADWTLNTFIVDFKNK